MSEHEEQCVLMEWAKLQEGRYPQLRLLFAIPNGGKLPYTRQGKHVFSPERLKLVEEGMKKGVPDLFLPVSSGVFFGLFIEMKFGKNKRTTEQVWWEQELSLQGYRVAVAYSFEEARDVIINYLDGQKY
jgi:hypothetical protein